MKFFKIKCSAEKGYLITERYSRILKIPICPFITLCADCVFLCLKEYCFRNKGKRE